MRRLWAACAAAMLVACGPEAAIWLRVEAPLRAPDDTDALEVEVHLGDASGEVVYQHTYPLDASTQFPQTLTLYTERRERASEVVWVQARALKGAALARPWSVGTTTAQFQSGRFLDAVVRLCDCP